MPLAVVFSNESFSNGSADSVVDDDVDDDDENNGMAYVFDLNVKIKAKTTAQHNLNPIFVFVFVFVFNYLRFSKIKCVILAVAFKSGAIKEFV